MLKLLNCPQNHFWEVADGEDGAAPRAPVCPVCGAPAENLPLLDLAPSAPEPASPPTPPPSREPPGRPVVAGYEIQEDLGRGPTGVAFYRARQVLVNRTVLLKVVTARDDPGQQAWGSLRGEATALGRLDHPHVVQIHEAGERDRQTFYNAVEFVDGPTLAQKIADKPLPVGQAVVLVEMLARAVHHAHQRGVVHRNLKPSSILLQAQEPEGEGAGPTPPCCRLHSGVYVPKITDFGLARRAAEGDVIDLDLQGELPCYLAPEQAWGRAKEVGPATDVYALGAILYELLATRPPFRGETRLQTLEQVQCNEPAPPSAGGRRVPADLEAVCKKCLAKQPRRRYRSALDLAAELRRHADGLPVKARPVGAANRLGRWVRRRPSVAALLLLSGVTFVLALVVLFGGPEKDPDPWGTRGGRSDRLADATELQEAKQREKQTGYYHSILLAERAWRAGRLPRARELLNGCPTELRHWEWEYLSQRVQNGRGWRQLQGAAQPVVALAYSPTGLRLAGAAAVQDVGVPARAAALVWDARNGLLVHRFPFDVGPIHDVAFSPDGTRLVVGGRNRAAGSGEVRGFDAVFGGQQPLYVVPYRDTTVRCLAVGSVGARLVVALDDGNLRVLDAIDGSESVDATFLPRPLPGGRGGELPRGETRVVVLDEAVDQVASTAPGSTVVELQERQRVVPPVELRGHTGAVRALAFNRKTNRLATGSDDTTARVWDPAAQTELLALRGHTGPVTAVAFSPDGKRLATASADRTVKLWDPATGQEILTLDDLKEPVAALAFSPGGRQLALAQKNVVTLWGVYTPPP